MSDAVRVTQLSSSGRWRPRYERVRAVLKTILTRPTKLHTRHSIPAEGVGQTHLAKSDVGGVEARNLALRKRVAQLSQYREPRRSLKSHRALTTAPQT